MKHFSAVLILLNFVLQAQTLPARIRLERQKYDILAEAVKNGDIDTITEMLNQGFDPTTRFKGKHGQRTLLHLAAEHDQIPIIQMLKERGVPLDITDSFGSTPLHYAAYNGKLNAVKELIGFGANINAKNDNNVTPLDDAIRKNHPDVIQILQEHNAELNNEVLQTHGSRRNNDQLHTIFDATMTGNIDKVKQMLDNGVNPSIHFKGSTDNDRTLLHVAAEYDQIPIIDLLHERGVPLDIKDYYGSTPLHYAAYNGKENAVKELLHLGANANIKNKRGITALDDAIRMHHPEVAQILENHNGNDVNYEPSGSRHGNAQFSAAFDAAKSGDAYKLKEILDEGVNPSIHFTGSVDKERTLLHVAAENDNIPVIQLLAEEGVNLDIKDGFGSTPLHYAAYNGKASTVKELIRLGADVNAKNKRKTTPLHDAVLRGHPQVVEILLENNANINATNYEYKTPFNISIQKNDERIIQLLIDYGATGGYKNIPKSKFTNEIGD